MTDSPEVLALRAEAKQQRHRADEYLKNWNAEVYELRKRLTQANSQADSAAARETLASGQLATALANLADTQALLRARDEEINRLFAIINKAHQRLKNPTMGGEHVGMAKDILEAGRRGAAIRKAVGAGE